MARLRRIDALDRLDRDWRLVETGEIEEVAPRTGPLVCTPFDRTGSLVALSTEAKKFSWGEEFQA
jgi:hypothetical protein